MTEVKLEKRFPHIPDEDVTRIFQDGYMKGWENARKKAIPIEFIEAFKKEFRAVASVKAVIEWLLEKWEDEQARLFEKQITEECVSAERFAEWEKENETN